MASTELTIIDPGKYLALNSAAEIAEIIEENLGGDQIQVNDLPRVKIPTGGSKTWAIETALGTESVKELDGVLIKFEGIRGYWKSKKVTGSPPDCSSDDLRVGVGSPGGACRACPLAQFGSAPPAEGEDEGRGQACKQREVWFLLRENDLLPLALSLPPTSLKAARQYRTNLTSANVRLTGVVTRVTLDAKDGPEGPYGVIVPVVHGALSDDDAERARTYAQKMREMLDQVAVDIGTTPDEPSDTVNLDTDEAA